MNRRQTKIVKVGRQIKQSRNVLRHNEGVPLSLFTIAAASMLLS
ncbi:hypothetical protein [Candidatus Magnetaquicoccus inordinatus]|nr:hypothetical protein [Candidatus Magnetaquicoccus inordinatus]